MSAEPHVPNAAGRFQPAGPAPGDFGDRGGDGIPGGDAGGVAELVESDAQASMRLGGRVGRLAAQAGGGVPKREPYANEAASDAADATEARAADAADAADEAAAHAGNHPAGEAMSTANRAAERTAYKANNAADAAAGVADEAARRAGRRRPADNVT